MLNNVNMPVLVACALYQVLLGIVSRLSITQYCIIWIICVCFVISKNFFFFFPSKNDPVLFSRSSQTEGSRECVTCWQWRPKTYPQNHRPPERHQYPTCGCNLSEEMYTQMKAALNGLSQHFSQNKDFFSIPYQASGNIHLIVK